MTGRRDPLNEMRAELGELDPEAAQARRPSGAQRASATPGRTPDHLRTGGRGPDRQRAPAPNSQGPPPAIYAGGLLALAVVVALSVWGIVSSARVDDTPGPQSGNAEDGGGEAVSAQAPVTDRDGDVIDFPDRPLPRDGAPDATALGDISGAWLGPAEGDQDWYDVHLTIGELNGEMSIWIDYPGIECGGVLVPDGATAGGDMLMLVEQLKYGHDTCVDNGDVYLWRTGSDQLYWEYVGDVRIWATLSPADTWHDVAGAPERTSPRDDAPAPAALGDISGVWSGPVEGDQVGYDAYLTIAELDGEWVIRISYPQLDCGGRLVPDGSMSGGDVLVLVEQLTYGHGTCVDNGGVYLWRAGSDQLYWEYFGVAQIWAHLDPQ